MDLLRVRTSLLVLEGVDNLPLLLLLLHVDMMLKIARRSVYP
jgi:hypothetical protein